MKRFLILFAAIFLCFSNTNAITKYVTTDFLNLRSGPGTSYSVITVLPKGTPVEIDEDCDCQWVWVRYNGYEGCISQHYLSTTNPCQYRRPTYFQSYSPSQNTYTRTSSKSVGFYTNVDGHRVQSPTYYPSVPQGATALCNDGTYSFSLHRRGTCSHHGGVARWF